MLREAYPASKQWVVHNGIDVTKFTPIKPRNAVPRIGIIANLQVRKGHEDFLKMAAVLTERGHDARYDIIGGDSLSGAQAARAIGPGARAGRGRSRHVPRPGVERP